MLTFNGILPNLFDQMVVDPLQFICGRLLILCCVGDDGTVGVVAVGEDGVGVVVLLCYSFLQLDVGGGGMEHKTGKGNIQRSSLEFLSSSTFTISIVVILIIIRDLAKKTPTEERKV